MQTGIGAEEEDLCPQSGGHVALTATGPFVSEQTGWAEGGEWAEGDWVQGLDVRNVFVHFDQFVETLLFQFVLEVNFGLFMFLIRSMHGV